MSYKITATKLIKTKREAHRAWSINCGKNKEPKIGTIFGGIESPRWQTISKCNNIVCGKSSTVT